jgi:uroporphyrinogen-III synthase
MTGRRSPRVLITRAAEDAPNLAHAIAEEGMEPVQVSAIQRNFDIDAMLDLATRASEADLLLVTSASVAEVMALATPEAWRDCEVAAVGPSTQRRLEALGWPVHHVPKRSTATDLLDLLGDVEGRLVAWPRANMASGRTAEALRERGATVHEAIAYHNVEPDNFTERLQAALPVDATTLMSGSAAQRIAHRVPEDARWKLGRLVVIGPSTRAAAEAAGLAVHAMAYPHSVAGLVGALKGLFSFAR